MIMRSLRMVFFLFLFLAFRADTFAQTGNPQTGKTLWEGSGVECRDCHGSEGQGGFGPDLAGRGLTLSQFIHAVRKPWGVMPAYAESQLSDRELTDLAAYFASLPSVAEPSPWRRPVSPEDPVGLQNATDAGCAQCHNPLFNNGRMVMGGIGADFEWFKGIVYRHTTALPQTRVLLGEPPLERLAMGSFSPLRVPESKLRTVWDYIIDIGFRPRMQGQLSAGVSSSTGVTYTLKVENAGVEGKGLTAEDLTITLTVPDGTRVIAGTGAGYQGLRRNEEGNADVAVWRASRMVPGDEQIYTITLSQAGTARNNLRGNISWTRPVVKTGPADSQNIPPAPLGQ